MKRKVFTVMATCCFLALGGAATAHAQLAGTTLRAMIPFDFSVRGKTLPAGESIVWALAKEKGTIPKSLRYPAEDGDYETARMNKLGL